MGSSSNDGRGVSTGGRETAVIMQWRTLTGRPVGDVVAFVRENARDGQAVHVGTDSLQLARHTRFVTVVAILTPGRGGRAIYRRGETHRSSRYVQELVGLVVTQGFRAVIKPGSWAASRTADRMVRAA